MYKPRTSSSNPYGRQNPSYSSHPFTNSIDESGINHGDRYSEVQFTPLHHRLAVESDDSGVISPPLWRNSPSPPRSPSRPLLGHQFYSPDSRAQAIARGRSELMEMVRHMPESSYELSLKDIVEHHHRAENQIPKTEDGSLRDKGGSDQRAAVGSKKEQSNNFDRKSSFENKGLFLNMAFPFSFKTRKKKKKNNIGSNSGRISPKPEGLKGGGEGDWWKKKFTGSSDSDSSRTSVNSGSSSVATASNSSSATRSSRGHDRGRRKSGCWHFFHLRRSKSA